jgi:hypothetical protein
MVVYVSHLCHACYIPRNVIVLNLIAVVIFGEVRIMEIAIKQRSPVSCFILALYKVQVVPLAPCS